MSIEYKYQKKLKVLLEYAYSHHNKQIILEYIPRLYKDKKILMIGIKRMNEKIIDSYNLKDMTQTDENVFSLFHEAFGECLDDMIDKCIHEKLEDEKYVQLVS